MPNPYPFLLTPILLPKVWGGDRLARFGKTVSSGDKVGESWELADLAATSSGGAGGGAFRSIIRHGPLAGQSLHQALSQWGDQLVGSPSRAPDGGFPILVKYLDAREHLSVQVHPSPAYAASNPGSHVKSECWLILAAEPGAVIYKGLRPGVTRESFEHAINADRVVDQIVAVPAVPGEIHNLPSGTCHALGAGVLVLEVQTASDTTFRVYDWGRPGRELHIRQALDCIDFLQPPPPPIRLDSQSSLATPNFTISRHRVGPMGLALRSSPGAFMIISGRGTLCDWLPGEPPLPVHIGDTGLAPASPTDARLIGDPADPLVCIRAVPH